MLDIAWPELVVIGAVALVAIGPKDLPKVMRTLGQWTGKARNLMHDIQRSMEQLSYETEIAEKLRKEGQTPPAAPAAPPETPTAKTDHDRPANT
jgi:sec-independent protein translocase protein TatB